MKLHPRLTRDTVALVTRFETFQPAAEPTGEGGWSIGYGHTVSAREGAHVSRDDARALLFYDLNGAAEVVEAALFAPVTQPQFEALCAFCFNVGADNFRRSSALARVNAGAELEAADEIERWRRAELGSGAQVVDTLVRRRAAEKAHFLGLPEGFSKSPSARVRPMPVHGGGITAEDAPGDVETAPSAALDAANGVQARLRELIPDTHVARTPPLTQTPSSETPESLIETGAAATLRMDGTPVEPPPAAAWQAEEGEPAPPPFDAPTPVEDPPPPLVVAPTPAPAVLSEPAAPAEPAPGAFVSPEPTAHPALAPNAQSDLRARRPFPRRGLYLLLTVVGACLFAAAAVLILGGRADLTNLGLGLLGAALMTPGVYGLLGPGSVSD